MSLHFLHDEHWQARASLQVHSQELDYAGVTQFGPRDAFCLKVAEEFLCSSRRLVFEEDLMKALGSTRSSIPCHLVHGSVGTLTKIRVGEHQVGDQ